MDVGLSTFHLVIDQRRGTIPSIGLLTHEILIEAFLLLLDESLLECEFLGDFALIVHALVLQLLLLLSALVEQVIQQLCLSSLLDQVELGGVLSQVLLVDLGEELVLVVIAGVANQLLNIAGLAYSIVGLANAARNEIGIGLEHDGRGLLRDWLRMEDQRVFGRVQRISEERVTPLLVALNRVYNGGGCDGFLLAEANSFPQGAKLARSQG